jgi:hypothetical protein
MAFIAPFHFLPLNTSCERASVRGTATPIAGLPSKHVANAETQGLGTTKIAKARGIARASVYRVLEVG